jgi:hypothetical protein
MKGVSIFLAALCLSLSFTNAQERTKPKSKAQVDYQDGIKLKKTIPIFFYMSASFTLRASRSDDFFFRSIVIASEAWRSHVHALGMRLPRLARNGHNTQKVLVFNIITI